MSIRWLTPDAPQDVGARAAFDLFKNAFLKRLDPDQMLADMTSRAAADDRGYTSACLAVVLTGFRNCSPANGNCEDPLLRQYVKLLLQKRLVTTGDLLMALLDRSRYSSTDPKPPEHKWGLPTLEESLFQTISQLHIAGEVTAEPRDFHRTTLAITRWLHVVREYETGKQLEHDAAATLYAPSSMTYTTYEALASMVLTVFGSTPFREVSKLKWWNERRAMVVRELDAFDSQILQWMQSQLSGRLRTLARIPPFLETDDKGRPIFTDQQILDSVADMPNLQTRAGLYIWLNACLYARPMTDDLSIFNFLQARYNDNNQSLATNLVIGCFDMYTNALLCKEHSHSLRTYRSFICNKVPQLLSMVAGLIVPPVTVENCVQVAFMSIAMDALPPISAGANDVRESLKKTRLEFLQACALFGLVSEGTISGIVQEATTLPRTTKLTREGLVAQCSNNLGRFEAVVEDLKVMNGNAGAVAGCVIDLVTNFSINKDTISLKSVCNILIKKLPEMDVVMQYTQPGAFLLPPVNVLNEWIHDQDQTEFTPSYEEFSSILLFTMAMIHRYSLTKDDLGLSGSDSFVFRLLNLISTSLQTSELTAEQNEQLSKWVEGLFSTDDSGETSGISDEVMRQCPPQSFYLLVPTLFEQSVLGCKANALTMKTLQGGLELLLEPFLLPSLLGGLSWLVKHSWEDHNDADVLLQILDRLLKPTGSSQDTQAMHRAILSIVAEPLVHTLQVLVRKQPNKKNAVALVELLKPYVGRQRTKSAPKAEINEWCATPDGGIWRCLRDKIRELVTWTSSIGPTPPTKYTHTLFGTACDILGPQEVLTSILAEFKEQTRTGNGPAFLDVVTSLICSPVPGMQPVPVNMAGGAAVGQEDRCSPRQVLRLIVADPQRLLDRPNSDMEAVIRLNRRVEAQSTPAQLAQIPLAVMAMPSVNQGTDQIMQDLGLTDGNDTSAIDAGLDGQKGVGQGTSAQDFAADLDLGAPTSQEMASLDMTSGGSAMQLDPNSSAQNFFDLNIDQSMGGMGGLNGGQDPNGEEDIFAGLDMGDMDGDFTFS